MSGNEKLCSHPEKRVQHLKDWKRKLLHEQMQLEIQVNEVDGTLRLVNAKIKYIEEQLSLYGEGQLEMEVQ